MKKNYFIEKLKQVWKTIDDFSDRIEKHHIFMLASGIAFNIIVYIIPLILVAIYISSNYVNIETINGILEDIFFDLLPPTESHYIFFKSLLNEIYLINKHSAIFGIVGVIGLLWISSTLISAIRISLNTVFEIESPKISIIYRLKDIILTIIFAILMLLYSYAIPLVSFIIEVFGASLPDWSKVYFSNTIIFFVSFITSFIIFFLIYRYVPNKRIERRRGLLSTIICVILIELSRYIFAFYITDFANYGKFYGTYAIIISISVWIYYSSLIILLAGEISNFILRK